MALITKIETLRKYVKLSYNSNAQVFPNTEMAERKYLLPILGATLYNALVADVNNPLYTTLLSLSRAVIAPMAVYHDLPFMQGMITETGVKVSSSDTIVSAPKWVYRELREGLHENAADAAENLTQYLFENKATLSWSNEAVENCVFKSGSDLATEYPIHQPFRTFIQLLPIIKTVEDLLRVSIGEGFYNSFLTAPSVDTDNKKATALIRKAVAHLTISKAVENFSVRIGANGFTVLLADNTDKDVPDPNMKHPSDRMLEMKRASAEETGKRYLRNLLDLLNEKASDTLFPAYYNSPFYTAPLEEDEIIPDDNEFRTGIFVL